jgi:hypothetical protein
MIFILCMTGLSSLLYAGEPGPEKAASTGAYTLVKTDQNISIYTKWIPMNETVSTRKVKAVFSVNAGIDEVLTLIARDGSYVKWMSGVSEYTRVKSVDAAHWYSYIKYGLPWPLADQDCIIKYEVERSGDGKTAHVMVTGQPDYVPVKSKVTRIPHLECEWVIRQTGDGRVAIEFSQYSKQAPKFPRWVTDPIIQKTLIKTIVAFKSELENS